MDDLDKKLFKDLSEKTVIPSKCEYVIKNAFNNNQRKNKPPIRNILLIALKTSGIVFLTSGVVFASSRNWTCTTCYLRCTARQDIRMT